MAEEPFALSTISPPHAEESDYDAICATVMESARGRWFLEEYARRNRNADTQLVLTAIERLEHLMRGERGQEADPGMRAELLEMARAIAQARTEPARPKEYSGAEGHTTVVDENSDVARRDIHDTAERLRDVAWTMRERGFDPATCQEIETLASSILAASSLQGPTDDRARKLNEVLSYLERRIGSMIEACAHSGEADVENAPPAEFVANPDSASETRTFQDAETGELFIGVKDRTAASEPAVPAGDPISADVPAEEPELGQAAQITADDRGADASPDFHVPLAEDASSSTAAELPDLETSGQIDVEPLVVGRSRQIGAENPGEQLELTPIAVEPFHWEPPPPPPDHTAASASPDQLWDPIETQPNHAEPGIGYAEPDMEPTEPERAPSGLPRFRLHRTAPRSESANHR
jgi:hypothetical protein